MMLDNNIITTYSGRKALLYLQRGGNLKRLCVHLDSSESMKWNCLASLWNPCILNVHKIINLDTNVSHTYKLRFNLLLKSLALKKLRAAKRLQSSEDEKNLASNIFCLFCTFIFMKNFH